VPRVSIEWRELSHEWLRGCPRGHILSDSLPEGPCYDVSTVFTLLLNKPLLDILLSNWFQSLNWKWWIYDRTDFKVICFELLVTAFSPLFTLVTYWIGVLTLLPAPCVQIQVPERPSESFSCYPVFAGSFEVAAWRPQPWFLPSILLLFRISRLSM